MVIGAIIVKHKIGLNDRETVAMISENIYLHYFCGLKCFQTKPPFHPTVLVAIRKRMGAVNFDSWNTLIGIASKFVTNFLSYFFNKSSQFYFHF